MKTMKRIIYILLGVLLTCVVVLVGIILFAEYSGKRFTDRFSETVSEITFTEEESRLVYDENGNLAELPGVTPDAGAASDADTAPNTETAPENEGGSAQNASSSGGNAASEAGSASETFIMDKSTAVFHKESCPENISIKEEDKTSMTGKREDVMERGYLPCPVCNP